MTVAQREMLAIEGGAKAFERMTGKVRPKVGMEEFMSIAERFGFPPAALERIRGAVSEADLGEGTSLARYFGPPKTKGVEYEALARQKFGVKHALSVSSGTGALHAAMVAVGVGPGTEVICPAVGFLATSVAVALAGGVPIFCDVDESLQMDPTKVEAHITPRTVAVVPTHHWGWVCDLNPILAIAKKHKLKVIEDCAQSPGAKYKGRPVGTIGDIGCFSISAYKIIGGGEGGLVITNDQRLFDRICQVAECGGLWRPDRFAPPRYDGELFVGTNYRLSELEAAVDVVQLGKLDEVVARYQHVSRRIMGQLRHYQEVRPQKHNDRSGEIGYLLRFYPATLDLAETIAKALDAEGIPATCGGRERKPDWHLASHMFPIILRTAATEGCSPFTDPRYLAKGGNVNYNKHAWPVADDLYERAVGISLNQWYSDEDCDNIARGINKVLSAYCTEIEGNGGWL